MAKKVFAMYLAKEGNPNSDAYAKLDLPASPWELWDALEKVRLQTDDILYMEIEDYYAFAYLRALEQRRTAYSMAGGMGRCVQSLSGTRRAGGTH